LKVYLFLILVMIGLFSCAKQEESAITTSLSGELKCINDNALEGITVDAINDAGTVVSTVTNASGQFTFPDLAAGNYKIHAKTANYYVYTDAEYDAIIADMWSMILGSKVITKQDLIAYHMIDFHNKLSTYDKLLFQKLKEQEYSIAEFIPWRIIHRDDFDNNTLYAVDTIPVTVVENLVNSLDILAFYVGDPQGNRCQ
jgi:hypothetical protein